MWRFRSVRLLLLGISYAVLNSDCYTAWGGCASTALTNTQDCYIAWRGKWQLAGVMETPCGGGNMDKKNSVNHGGAFSAREVEYLNALPAVKHVIDGRIIYADAFKRECMRRYYAGESPTEIFRQAGLDSQLIGYKRIERCIARWKRSVPRNESVPSQSYGDAAYKSAYRNRGEPRAQVGASAGMSLGTNTVWSGVEERASVMPVNIFDDVSQLVIAQQARRIDELECTVNMLRRHYEPYRSCLSRRSQRPDVSSQRHNTSLSTPRTV